MSGLAAARQLQSFGMDVTVLESRVSEEETSAHLVRCRTSSQKVTVKNVLPFPFRIVLEAEWQHSGKETMLPT